MRACSYWGYWSLSNYIGFEGEKYFISFIDDYSKIAGVYPMKLVAEVCSCIIEYINESENLTG